MARPRPLHFAQPALAHRLRLVQVIGAATPNAANRAYATELGIRGAQFCDFRYVLVAGCNPFSRCHANADAHYQIQLESGAVGDQDDRMECFKAGDLGRFQQEGDLI